MMHTRRWLLLFVVVMSFIGVMSTAAKGPPVQVGSKAFTEGVILGEIISQLITRA
ncbi:MAG: hypothetical protein H7X80_07925, partial [bacterium]|nr:hypothetical protein [Candidatus Kapabacteria bacterium]